MTATNQECCRLAVRSERRRVALILQGMSIVAGRSNKQLFETLREAILATIEGQSLEDFEFSSQVESAARSAIDAELPEIEQRSTVINVPGEIVEPFGGGEDA